MLSQFSPPKMTSRAGSSSSIPLSSRVSSSSSTPLSSRVSSSSSTLSSNPGSPVSLNRERKDSSSDTEYNPKTYTNELAESGLKEERFRIDRKKLEDMLQVQQNGNGKTENAEDFFQKVMLETSTQISWPSKLKIGAKSKKDPHVKIVGTPEAVQMAKDQVLEVLDTKKNRVTLKMDVSHSDHSYAIGKGGFKIQQVMEETGCHIHFPDSNRNSTAEKSNQVSIAGQAAGVEQARIKIRDLLPLVFTFELPNGENINPGEECSPAVQHIQQTYSFNVAFRPIGPVGMGRTLLVVRGCQRLLSRLRQGLALLMEYLTGSKTIPVRGFMKTEIAPQHHQFVMGSGNVNIQMIMNKTGATIIFPDPTPSAFGGDSPSQSVPLIAGHSILRSKSTVLIQGSFDSVCLAWQELLKSLPLVLMFDLKEGQELDPVMVNNFMEAFNINIMVRPKMKENTKSVLIRGAEKDSRILFQVRKEILGLEEDDSCPPSPSLKQNNFRIPTIETFKLNPNQEANKKAGMSTAESLNILSNIIQQNPQIVGLLNNLSTAFPSNAPEIVQPHKMPSGAVFRKSIRPNPLENQQIQVNPFPGRNVASWINRPDRSYAFSSGVNVSNFLQKDRQLPIDDGDSGILQSHNRLFNGFGSKSDLSREPESSASSTSSNETPEFATSRFARHFHGKDHSVSNADVHQLLAEYGNKKLTASKAMHQSVDGVRTPNTLWSGFGFSKSMPDFSGRKRSVANSGSMSEFLETGNGSVSDVETASTKTWNDSDVAEKPESPLEEATSPFALSNFWENVPRKPPINYGSIKNLEQLLRLLDLEKYNEVFALNEIDMSIFLTLNEIQLQRLYINYGARRKMLTAIAAIREQRLGDWSKQFRAAPGAERRTCFPGYSGSSAPDVTNA
ncbi:protein bicaudal C homolog 1 [Trichonephila inaurata madagascariensis]|uniref:Protein bicaudal C homolog 1 n=1 Tax=Trichonephila inaurata madagascariensis TaxID=2747483 RepID=A0A8X6YHK7_9ARAC|nr:protein bicaudal C homolog 1 [Trichonephila inaurata madagascariensis]